MRREHIVRLLVIVAVVLVGATGGALAHGGEGDVGASYHCSEGASGGGNGVWVDSSGGVSTVNAFTVLGIASDATFYAQQSAEDPTGRDTCDDGSGGSHDYVEAHTGPAQFCYSEANEGENGALTTNGDDACHTARTGPA